MTIVAKMHTTLTSLQGALADMKSFALDSQDQTAKQMFNVTTPQNWTTSYRS